jgi:hypothetical protein
MKSKILISLLIASVMLVTLATPALAGKPQKCDILEWSGSNYIAGTETGFAKYQVTHDNQLKITIVVEGLTPGETYQVYDSPDGFIWGTDFITVNDRGILKFRGTSTAGFTAYTSHRVFIRDASYTVVYASKFTTTLNPN